MNLDQIAAKIRDHLLRLEKDAEWNKRATPASGLILWHPHCYRAGSRVACVYVSYQGRTTLLKSEAIRYLEMLDAGFKGRHFEAFRESAK